MLREIKNAIYCIASYTGNRHFVECDSEDELAAYVAEGECKGYSVTSVTRICTDGSRPRVAVKSNPYYKKTIKELKIKFYIYFLIVRINTILSSILKYKKTLILPRIYHD